jgi:hypothetical protein
MLHVSPFPPVAQNAVSAKLRIAILAPTTRLFWLFRRLFWLSLDCYDLLHVCFDFHFWSSYPASTFLLSFPILPNYKLFSIKKWEFKQKILKQQATKKLTHWAFMIWAIPSLNGVGIGFQIVIIAKAQPAILRARKADSTVWNEAAIGASKPLGAGSGTGQPTDLTVGITTLVYGSVAQICKLSVFLSSLVQRVCKTVRDD